MTALDLDWGKALDWALRWELLEPSDRARVLEAKPRQALRDVPSAEAERLLAAGIARPGGTARTLELAADFHELHKFLRALKRTLIDEAGGGVSLATYLREVLSAERRSALLGSRRPAYGGDLVGMLAERVASAAHVRGFLDAPDRLAWLRERDAAPQSPHWSHARLPGDDEASVRDEQGASDLARVIEALIRVGGMTPAALAQHLDDLPRPRLGRAVRAALRCVLAVAGLDAQLHLAIRIWPPVRDRLLRSPAGPPAQVRSAESLCLAWRLEDLTQLVVRAAEPLRVKADGRSLFAAVEKSLESELAPLPQWLEGERRLRAGRAARLAAALVLAQDLHLLERRGRSGRDLGLVTSRAGWSWLEQPPDERLRGLLDLQRAVPAGEDDLDLPDLEDLLDIEFDGDELDPYSGRRLAAWRLASASPFSPHGDPQVVRSAIAAWSSLASERAVRLEDFLAYHVARANPLLDPAFEGRAVARYPWHQPSEEQLEGLWHAHLERVLVEFLLPLGGVSIGRDAAQACTVELTSVGRYLLGLADAFEVAAPPPTERPARVQPDFEVVFLAPSPAHEAAIGRFGERIGSGVGALFRLTRAAAQTAALTGLSADEALRTLADASATPVPPNVARELRDWFAACRRIEIQPVELIRCPDAQTAARVLAAAGRGKLELLSESTLAIADLSQRSAVVRACRKAGLFLIEDSEPAAAERKRPRSRRRRRGWS